MIFRVENYEVFKFTQVDIDQMMRGKIPGRLDPGMKQSSRQVRFGLRRGGRRPQR